MCAKVIIVKIKTIKTQKHANATDIRDSKYQGLRELNFSNFNKVTNLLFMTLTLFQQGGQKGFRPSCQKI